MDEANNGLKIGVGLTVLAVIIAIVVGVVIYAQSQANKSMNAVQQKTNAMSELAFKSYDQTEVSGSEVKACIATYSDQQVAIVVGTSMSMGATTNADTAFAGINYNGLLDGASLTAPEITMTAIDEKQSFYVSKYADPLAINGKIADTSISGTKGYIRPSAKFIAHLIKDDTGGIIGVAFKQKSLT